MLITLARSIGLCGAGSRLWATKNRNGRAALPRQNNRGGNWKKKPLNHGGSKSRAAATAHDNNISLRGEAKPWQNVNAVGVGGMIEWPAAVNRHKLFDGGFHNDAVSLSRPASPWYRHALIDNNSASAIRMPPRSSEADQ